MADGILTRTRLQVANLYADPPRTVPLPAGVWTLIADQDVSRLTLTVILDPTAAPVLISPAPLGSSSGVAVVHTGLPIQVHAAFWPLLITGQWWALAGNNSTAFCIEVNSLKE